MLHAIAANVRPQVIDGDLRLDSPAQDGDVLLKIAGRQVLVTDAVTMK